MMYSAAPCVHCEMYAHTHKVRKCRFFPSSTVASTPIKFRIQKYFGGEWRRKFISIFIKFLMPSGFFRALPPLWWLLRSLCLRAASSDGSKKNKNGTAINKIELNLHLFSLFSFSGVVVVVTCQWEVGRAVPPERNNKVLSDR